MALLNVLPPSINQTQADFNQQTYQGINSIQSWSSLILSNLDVDYIQDSNNNVQQINFACTSQIYQSIPNFTFNITPKNKLTLVNFNLTLQGNGYVGLFVNGQVLREIPFNNTNFSAVNFNRFETFSTSSNKISLSLRVNSGTVTLASTKTQPFFNYFQAIDINS